MKLKITLALMLCAMMHMLGAQRANAQTSISLNFATDSTYSPCPAAPVAIDFVLGGMSTGYSASDMFDVHVYFGDGNDTIFTIPQYQANGFWANFTHTYNAPGIFSVQYIVTGPDANADTLTNYNEVLVGTGCGNISGHVYHDVNTDCSQGAGEPSLSSIPVSLMYNNQLVQGTWTDSNGDYFFTAPTGYNYTITIGSNYYGYSVACPASGSYAVNNLPSAGNDFGVTCNGGFDLEAVISGWGFRPGLPAYVYVSAVNHSCNSQSGQIQVTLDPMLTYTSATPAPTSVSGNVVTWNFTNLNNANWYQNFQIQVMTSLAANIGDTVCNMVVITPLSGDLNPSNNTEISCTDVRNSWDPNMKEVSPEGIGANGNVAPNTTFDYTIHFQNTGSDAAYNIYVLDTLDSDLDVSTLKVTGMSHFMSMDILPGNVMKFNFNNIMLADSNSNEPASHGYVSYEVRTKSGLANGTQIDNTAYIYFDFNPAVVTNTTLNTIDIVLGVNEMMSEEAIAITPNPASDVVALHFTGVEDNSEVQLVDMTGRVMGITTLASGEAQMNVSSLPAGVYMLCVKSASGTIQQRLVVVH